MKHEHQSADGRMEEEKIDVDPKIPSPEEIARRLEREQTGSARKGHPEAAGEGPEVTIDPHWPNLKLPEHPRGEGWIYPDPEEPIT